MQNPVKRFSLTAHDASRVSDKTITSDLVVAREIYDREAIQGCVRLPRGPKSRAHCSCLVDPGPRRRHVDRGCLTPWTSPQVDEVSAWVHLDSSGFDLRGLAPTVFTSWPGRWRLATSIPPAMAGGGSDPCTGSTVKISLISCHPWPGEMGARRGDCASQASRFLASRVLFVTSQAAPGCPWNPSNLQCARPSETEASVGSIIHEADGRKPAIQSPLSPAILRPYPELLSSKSRHWPRRGYPCCVARRNAARPASQ